MSAERLVKLIRDEGAVKNSPSVEVCEVISLSPFEVKLNELVLSSDYDTFYLNGLILDENINLDLSKLQQNQSITGMSPAPWTALNTPTSSYSAKISGTIPQFLTDFYNYFKAWQNRYIIHVGDLLGIQKLGNNTYIIVEKVQKL